MSTEEGIRFHTSSSKCTYLSTINYLNSAEIMVVKFSSFASRNKIMVMRVNHLKWIIFTWYWLI